MQPRRKSNDIIVLCQSDVIMFCLIHSTYSGAYGSLFLTVKIRHLMGSKKKNLCVDGLEKSIPLDHHLSSIGKPNGDALDRFIYPILTLI